MTRKEHEEAESFALAAMIGLPSNGTASPPEDVARQGQAFDMSDAFRKERLARIGETSPFDM